MLRVGTTSGITILRPGTDAKVRRVVAYPRRAITARRDAAPTGSPGRGRCSRSPPPRPPPRRRRPADRRREPDAGRGREPADAAMLVVLEDDPGAEEADAGDQA